MAYYIKTIGIRGERIGISEGRFEKMLSSKMCFRTNEGNVQDIQKGDKFVIYCIRNGVREFPQGGFIGIQSVLSSVYEERGLFEHGFIYVVDIEPQIRVEPKQEITLAEIRKWEDKSTKLENALEANLQAIGGLLEIEKSDYMQFYEEFEARIN